jgi:hypothetical protein
MGPREIIGQWIAEFLADMEYELPPDGGYDSASDADRLLKALDEQGMAVVPKAPTDEMKMAGYKLVGDIHYVSFNMLKSPGWGDQAGEIYEAMIEAANPNPFIKGPDGL